MARITDIRLALKTLLLRLKTANGYSTDLPDEHIYDVFDGKIVSNKADDTYPKAFFLLDDGTYQKQPSNRMKRTLLFILVVIVKQLGDGVLATTKIENIIQDVEDLIHSDDTLGGAVQDVYLRSFTSDSGYAAPEGVAVFQLVVDFYDQR